MVPTCWVQRSGNDSNRHQVEWKRRVSFNLSGPYKQLWSSILDRRDYCTWHFYFTAVTQTHQKLIGQVWWSCPSQMMLSVNYGRFPFARDSDELARSRQRVSQSIPSMKKKKKNEMVVAESKKPVLKLLYIPTQKNYYILIYYYHFRVSIIPVII